MKSLGAKRRALAFTLAAAMLFGSVQRSRAPLQIYVVLGIKVVFIGMLGATGYILSRADPNYYLVRVSEDGQAPYWIVSAASAATLAKNEGWVRCEGPSKDHEELAFRAWCNNQDPSRPMFPCGPLGSHLPPPTWTNASIASISQSKDGGQHWAPLAEVPLADGEDNFSVGLLPSTGTNGLSRDQLLEFQGCDLVITNTAGRTALFRMQ